MIRRINYTSRTRVKQESVDITVREISGAPPVATAAARLDEYDLPPDADVVIEAYRKAEYQREHLGTVSALPAQCEFVLHQFDSPAGVRFRLKVIGKRDDAAKDAPLLLAIADKIAPNEGDDQDAHHEKLLSLVPADLDGEVWRLDLEDGPVLQIDRAYWDERQFVRSNWFFPLVIPSLLRATLTAALADNYRELDDEDWQSRWLRLALMLPGEQELPDQTDDIEGWVNARVEAFCRQFKMRDKFEAVLRGGE